MCFAGCNMFSSTYNAVLRRDAVAREAARWTNFYVAHPLFKTCLATKKCVAFCRKGVASMCFTVCNMFS